MRSLALAIDKESQYSKDASKLCGELQHFHHHPSSLPNNTQSSPAQGHRDEYSRRLSIPTHSTEHIGQYKLETVSLFL